VNEKWVKFGGKVSFWGIDISMNSKDIKTKIMWLDRELKVEYDNISEFWKCIGWKEVEWYLSKRGCMWYWMKEKDMNG
jgi:hypothetical protein